ncbi:MAG: MerR family transcriptional regulator [Bacteroidales bacterium]|nr:MerR family transcriptional regulator [Candidatus Cacconaster merdequi]
MEKMYYTIGEVSEILSEESSTVRFWSNTFPRYIRPERNAKGNRLFHPKDIENLKLIQYLVRDKGMTLDGVARRLSTNKEGLDKTSLIVEKLKGIRNLLEELKETI